MSASSTLSSLANGKPAAPSVRLPADPGLLHPAFGECPNRMHHTPMAAACIGVAASSMEVDRCRRRWRIPHTKIGRKILYKEADLLAFLACCRVEG